MPETTRLLALLAAFISTIPITAQNCPLSKEANSLSDSAELEVQADSTDFYLFPGGYYTYAAPTTGSTHYHYYLTDHLGNNRVVINGNDSVEQVTHYYPFGTVYADAGTAPDFQKYKYTSKELDLTHGLSNYDHGARQNYSVLGVWDRIDPMAEKYYNASPYVLCGNNPINAFDSNGNSITIHYHFGCLGINTEDVLYRKGEMHYKD